MTTYKISKDNWATYENFNSMGEAENWTLIKLGNGYIIEISPEQFSPMTPEERLWNDREFGKYLIGLFLIDNRLIEPSVTPVESLELMKKFEFIEKLANLGDIKSVQILLGGIQTDNRIFTQERKDRYFSIINGYLQN